MSEESKEQAAINGDMRELLKLKHFRNFLWRLLSSTGLYADNFTGDNYTFYLQGKQAVGLEILQMLEDADPTAYATMLLEQQKLKAGK